MEVKRFREALYYAVREDFNADISLGYVESNPKWVALIREAIAFFESHKGKKFPHPMSGVEITGLARAARRRIAPSLFSTVDKRRGKRIRRGKDDGTALDGGVKEECRADRR